VGIGLYLVLDASVKPIACNFPHKCLPCDFVPIGMFVSDNPLHREGKPMAGCELRSVERRYAKTKTYFPRCMGRKEIVSRLMRSKIVSNLANVNNAVNNRHRQIRFVNYFKIKSKPSSRCKVSQWNFGSRIGIRCPPVGEFYPLTILGFHQCCLPLHQSGLLIHKFSLSASDNHGEDANNNKKPIENPWTPIKEVVPPSFVLFNYGYRRDARELYALAFIICCYTLAFVAGIRGCRRWAATDGRGVSLSPWRLPVILLVPSRAAPVCCPGSGGVICIARIAAANNIFRIDLL
jgi:hypothetical protein